MMNIDFGKFPAPEKNKIKVDADMWQEYVRVRMRFEELHQELFNKTRRP